MSTATPTPIGGDARGQLRAFGSLGSVVGLLVLTWAAALASRPLNDNSFFTHLATGRLILDEGSVPTRDPYTFTAHGEPWTVQSWLASVGYAAAERLAGDVGLRIMVLVVFLVAAALLWRLTEPASSLLVRLVLVASALLVAVEVWSERPYMIGVVGVAFVWLALDDHAPAWLVAPFLWVWANAHGSWVLAPALVALYVAGASVDRWRGEGRSIALPDRERHVAVAVAVGSVAAAIGPLGAGVWLFPLRSLRDGGAFGAIAEWQPPGFDTASEQAFLFLTAAVVLLLVRKGSFRLAAPSVVFALAAMYAQRNIALATVVLVAAGARATPAFGTLHARTTPHLGRPAAWLAGVALVSAAGLVAASPTLDGGSLSGYPARALSWWTEARLEESRTAVEMSTGNLLEALDGPTVEVFVDDRVDMFPPEVVDDYLRLAYGRPGWQQVLDRYEVDYVLWSSSEPLANVLASDPRWAVVYTDTGTTVACRRGPQSRC